MLYNVPLWYILIPKTPITLDSGGLSRLPSCLARRGGGDRETDRECRPRDLDRETDRDREDMAKRREKYLRKRREK